MGENGKHSELYFCPPLVLSGRLYSCFLSIDMLI
jgi:hypothetical protein